MRKLILFSSLFFFVLNTNFLQAQFAGGNGSMGDPFQIANVNQLQEMRNYLSSHFIIINNIDASATSGWNGGLGFEPVGGIFTSFTGSLNGNGFIITGLTINRPSQDRVGLFGFSRGEITDVAMVNVNITGRDQTGGLVGWYDDGTITASYSTGSVSGVGVNVGGLVGRIVGGTITTSYSTGSVSGVAGVGGLVGRIIGGTITTSYSTGSVSGGGVNIGGLVGRNESAQITTSYSTGSVSGGSQVGGLVGRNESAQISTSYSTGSVSGNETLGGLVGWNSSSGTISTSYSTGSVSGNGSSVGGLVGRNESAQISTSYSTGSVSGSSLVGGLVGRNESGQITTSYWNSTTSGQATSAGGTGLSDSQFRQQGSFSGFDFASEWDILTGSTTSYPFLQSNPQDPPPGILTIVLFPPTTETIPALSITSSGAQLNGIINPNGTSTDAYFEWGTDVTLNTFSTTSTQSIGSGSEDISLADFLTGLNFNTIYYFRAVGENSAGIVKGEILSFTTLTLQNGVQLIVSKVNQLVASGVLNNGNGNALRATLNAAINQINKNNNATAVNQLNAFLNQVNAFINSGRLTPEQGGELIDDANAIITQLQGNGDNIAEEIPESFELSQNYPNPFNPYTNINFALPVDSRVTLKIYDIAGREVTTLVNEIKSAGYHVASFDASHLSSGVYFYRIEAQDISGSSGERFITVKRMILVK